MGLYGSAPQLWRQGKGDFFLGCLLLAELSTPCVCLSKVLILLGRQHTALHRLNGLTLLITFLLCRVLLFPYLYYTYGRHRGLPLLRVPAALPPATNMAAAALLAPQLYWFGLICRGAWRMMGARTHTERGGESPITRPIESPKVGPIESPIMGPIESPKVGPIETPIMGPIESPKVGPIESPITRPIESPIMGPIESPIGSPIVGPIESPSPQRHPP
ncbi:ceramide synthase-like [Melopsittacus undulatus]|uniref:ceramide synthase-like n=1 Tax=Melopsittacus undulatus TaxID=13146 RepID=UPI00146DEA0D|nr:ceramide synthase-like [Melopsittacus undulatus]